MEQTVPAAMNPNQTDDVRRIKQFIAGTRIAMLQAAHRAGGGHIAPAFSCHEIITTLYQAVLRTDPKRPDWEDRDRFLMDKGHGCLSLFVVLAKMGFFPEEWLDRIGRPGCALGGHVDEHVPGIEATLGSLGHGLPIGVGMALAAKIKKQRHRVFVLLSDGGSQEGTVWESAMLAASHNLDNLTAVLDYNKLQSLGHTIDVMPAFEPVADKWRAFGWRAWEVNGNDIGALLDVFRQLPFAPGKPSIIIAHTVKGKGVSFMEDTTAWHVRNPSDEELARACKELEAQDKILRSVE